MAKQRAGAAGPFDVAIIGAGVVGTAIARDLAQFDISIVLLEARDDVGDGISKANTAILHTGYDMVPGSLEARLVRRGYELLKLHAARAGIATEATGALLVAWSLEENELLPGILANARANNYWDAYLIEAAEVYRREPNLGRGAIGALVIPGEWIIDPWSTTLSYAIQAKQAGVLIELGARADWMGIDGGMHRLRTGRGTIEAHYLVNAAGLFADEIDRQGGHCEFSIYPRRGELIVFDKFARSLLTHVILPVPTAMGKGVLVAPTIFGNVMLGPTAENRSDKMDTASSAGGIEFLRNKGARILPGLFGEEITAIYAGLRAASASADYQIHAYGAQRRVTAAAIRSTGLTASIAIAEYVRDLLLQMGINLGTARELPAVDMPNLGEARPRPYQLDNLISTDAGYGEIVCHCERVTRGEIRDALAGPIPPRSAGALARRTRAGLGRCQGFYCQAELACLLDGSVADRR